jgi:hypothetical protein
MEMIPVSSSNIAAIGYEETQNTLVIEFNNGRAYEYYSVPQYVFDEFLNAGSKGQYANLNIYKNYSQSQIR